MTEATDRIKRTTQFGTLTPEGKVVNAMEIDLHKVPSDDPLAYAFGLFQGKTGQKMRKSRDLAPQYVRGFKEGEAIFKKEAHKWRKAERLGVSMSKAMYVKE